MLGEGGEQSRCDHAENVGECQQPQQLEGGQGKALPAPGGPPAHPLSERPHSRVEGLLLKPSCQDSPWVCTFSPLSRIFQGQNTSVGFQRSTRLPSPPANVSEPSTHRASVGTSCVSRQDSRDGAGTFQVLPSCPGPRISPGTALQNQWSQSWGPGFFYPALAVTRGHVT